MARTYKRDSRGRFSGGGGGGGRPAARGVSRGTNRLTRDNAGRITSVGGNGATARGGRLRTASGKQRATQTARISGGRAAGTVTRGGARRTAAAAATTPPSKLKRSGKTIKIAQKKAPTPTKEDKSIEKVRNLKAAQPAFGRGQSGAVFVPDKALTPKRRQSLGLSAFASRAESQRWSVSRQQFGSQSGVLISERGGYRASLPKQRQGVIKRPTKPTTRAAAPKRRNPPSRKSSR